MSTIPSSSECLKAFDEFYKNKLKHRLFEKFSNEPLCIKKVNERFEFMIDYNTPHGKKLRGLCAFESLLYLAEEAQRDEALIEQTKAIGWCIEFVS